jgi:hypothetical protein
MAAANFTGNFLSFSMDYFHRPGLTTLKFTCGTNRALSDAIIYVIRYGRSVEDGSQYKDIRLHESSF